MKDRLKEITKLRQEARHSRIVASSADPARSVDFQIDAVYAEAAAAELEYVALPATIVAGEVVPSETERPDSDGGFALRNTLQNPDTAAIAASMDRTDLLSKSPADVLALGIDAAQSIPDASSLEKMLAHQMALAHKAAFRLMENALEQRESVEMARLVNASARMMSVYQQGLLTIQRLRTGGKQLVTVQHVNINGGQAVVAGTLQPGGSSQQKAGRQDETEE